MQDKFKITKFKIIVAALLIAVSIIVVDGIKVLFINKSVNVVVKDLKHTQLSSAEKLEDFNYIYDILKNTYPYFDEKNVF